jgi:hypothetical protein
MLTEQILALTNQRDAIDDTIEQRKDYRESLNSQIAALARV